MPGRLQEPHRERVKLVLVLERDMEGPRKQLPASYFSTASRDQGATTSAGDQTPIFSPERACATAQTETFPTTSNTALVVVNSARSCSFSTSSARTREAADVLVAI